MENSFWHCRERLTAPFPTSASARTCLSRSSGSVLAAPCQPERIKHLLFNVERVTEQPLWKWSSSHWPRASKAISPLISLVKAWLSQGEISHSPSLHLLHPRVHSSSYSELCSSIKRRRWMRAPDYSGGRKLSPTQSLPQRMLNQILQELFWPPSRGFSKLRDFSRGIRPLV